MSWFQEGQNDEGSPKWRAAPDLKCSAEKAEDRRRGGNAPQWHLQEQFGVQSAWQADALPRGTVRTLHGLPLLMQAQERTLPLTTTALPSSRPTARVGGARKGLEVTLWPCPSSVHLLAVWPWARYLLQAPASSFLKPRE